MTDTDTDTKNSRQVPWPWFLGVIAAIVIYFASSIAGEFAISLYPLFQGWTMEQAGDWLKSSTAAQFAYVASIEAVTIGLLYLFLRFYKAGFRALGLIKPRAKDALYAILAYPPYLIINIVVTLAAGALLSINVEQEQQLGFESVVSNLDLILTFLSLVILPPLVEEIMVRGFLFGSLKKGMPVVAAAIVTSGLFGLLHLQFGSGAPLLWVAAIDTFVLSLFLCYLREKTGSLWPAIYLHMLKNGLAFFVLFIAPTWFPNMTI